MTPKEKAKHLIDKYAELVPDDFGGMDDELAKQCALIAVDEILSEIYSNNFITSDNRRIYWQQVKTEIELL